MKRIVFCLLIACLSLSSFAQETEIFTDPIDSIEKSYTYQHGLILLKGGVAELTVPDGFKYLDAEQATSVLVDLWGNPKYDDMTLGLLLPEACGVLSDSGYVFNISYNEIGYVEDDDAEDIDYEELLASMKKEAEENNVERIKQGYEAITPIGWASKPFYDKEHNILHWAKELKFGENEENTLNYNVRVLGRKGVLVLNAIATMPNLKLVQNDIHNVLNIVKFKEGFQYKDFDSSIDEVAAWSIGGLVAGKVLAKVGLFAAVLKFWKIIAIAVAAFFGGIWKRFKGGKEEV